MFQAGSYTANNPITRLGNAVASGATSSGTLSYTGSGGTNKAINVAGIGGDTVQNGGTGRLTLSGTVTIYGTALNFNDNDGSGLTVTGAIRMRPGGKDIDQAPR